MDYQVWNGMENGGLSMESERRIIDDAGHPIAIDVGQIIDVSPIAIDVGQTIDVGQPITINSVRYIGDDENLLYNGLNANEDSFPLHSFKILSSEELTIRDMRIRLIAFHQWLKIEQADLEEECGADLNGLIDKLEETFPELSEESEDSLDTIEYDNETVRNLFYYDGPHMLF